MSGWSAVALLQHDAPTLGTLLLHQAGHEHNMLLWSILLSILLAQCWNGLSIRSAHNDVLVHLSSGFRYYSCVIANCIQFLFALSCLPQLTMLSPHVHWPQALGQSQAVIVLCDQCNCICIYPSCNNIPNSILWRLFVRCGLEGWESPFNSRVWD